MKWCLFEALGLIAPITSMLHIENDHGADNTPNRTSRALTLSAKAWHFWHFLTWIQKSFSIVSQKYPALRIFRAMACLLAWVPNEPSCSSLSNCSTSLESTHRSNTISWFLLYSTSPFKRKLAANLCSVLLWCESPLPCFNSD